MNTDQSARVGVFHPGTQHSWQTALAFQAEGQLRWFATSVFYRPNSWPYRAERLLPATVSARVHREFTRRHHPALDPRLIREFGLWEWAETLARRAGWPRAARILNAQGNKSFAEPLVHLMQREPVDVIWGFNGSSLEAFRWAKAHGISCVLDQTIGHPVAQNLAMEREFEVHASYFLDADDWRIGDAAIERQDEELRLADVVVSGSEQCAETVREFGPGSPRQLVIPYGFEASDLRRTPSRSSEFEPAGPLKLLFVGSVAPRKGVAHLLKAVDEFSPNDVSLTLVGQRAISKAAFASHAARITHIPQVPRSDVARYLASADCFVFPSLFEGSALVLYEACGAGLGIIQSKAGGTGTVDGFNGVILPDPVTVESLVSEIAKLVEMRQQAEQWSAASLALAPQYSWARYRTAVRDLVADLSGSSEMGGI